MSLPFTAPLAAHEHAAYADAAAMVAALRPEQPVYCIRPHVLREAARHFVETFPGKVLYAVKCNAEPAFLDALHEGGIRHFDTASLPEISVVAERFADTTSYFMHPVKQRGGIRAAYGQHGVRHFVVDHADELAKVMVETGGAADAVIVVRLATARGAAVYDLGGKFGASPAQAAALLRQAYGAGRRVGLSFHVGSQCLTPGSYTAALRLAAHTLDLAGVPLSVIDVGGGFPVAYVGLHPPPLEDYVAAIRAGLAGMELPAECELWCEPGRALVAAGASLVVRVELRRDNFLYINDGVYGSLSDLKYAGLRFPMRVLRPVGDRVEVLEENLGEFSLFGPTCDAVDVMEGPYRLAADVREGDYIEIGQAGAYTLELRTDFNGFCPDRFVEVGDGAFLPTAEMEPVPFLSAAAE
ncbi:type III PLP-dependent enzyme [Skermanella sp. TT6]|uniref:ornithine decarboxylase n=1 Tax=Skermanella cutis TaxID=2775420 RepID=A0ABX7B0L0_9PROT|nr:type III PLP-dependent enzyme [Skermanella sp. TT6]QQP87865.1 type III PLP-dependent enzyme [Skermanella sp. TT6]